MVRSFRAGAAVAACAATLALTAPVVAHAEPEAAGPVDRVTGGLVQIKSVITGSVFVHFDVENGMKEWSRPVTVTKECTGVAVEGDRIVTSASCVDPKSYGILSTMRGEGAVAVGEANRKTEGVLELLRTLGEGQKWTVASSPDSPDSPPTITTTVRRVGEDASATSPANLEASTYGVDGQPPLTALLKLNQELEGVSPLPFSEEEMKLGDPVYVASPTAATFDGPPAKAALRKSTVARIPVENGDRSPKIDGETKPQEFGAVVVDEDGVVVGLMPYGELQTAVDASSVRKYLLTKDVEFASLETEEESNLWLWLGPVLGVVGLLVIGGVVFLVVRRRRKKALAQPAQANGFVGQFPQDAQQQHQFGQPGQFGAQPGQAGQYGQPGQAPQYGQAGQYGAQPGQYDAQPQTPQFGRPQPGQQYQPGQQPQPGQQYGQPPSGPQPGQPPQN